MSSLHSLTELAQAGYPCGDRRSLGTVARERRLALGSAWTAEAAVAFGGLLRVVPVDGVALPSRASAVAPASCHGVPVATVVPPRPPGGAAGGDAVARSPVYMAEFEAGTDAAKADAAGAARNAKLAAQGARLFRKATASPRVQASVAAVDAVAAVAAVAADIPPPPRQQAAPSAGDAWQAAEPWLSDTKGIYTAPNISANRLAAARDRQEIPPGEEIFVLCDCTVRRNAREAILITSAGLRFRVSRSTPSKTPVLIPWGEFAGLAVHKGASYMVKVGPSLEVNVSACGLNSEQMVGLLQAMQQLVVPAAAAATAAAAAGGSGPAGSAAAASSITAPAGSGGGANIQAKLLEHVGGFMSGQKRCYAGRGIPAKKLQKARAKQGVGAEEEVFVLVDVTVFGSAADAILFTSAGVRFRIERAVPSKQPILVPWADFCDLEIGAGKHYMVNVGPELKVNTSACRLSGRETSALLHAAQAAAKAFCSPACSI